MSEVENISPEQDKSEKTYRVFARKYRPQNFEELIGQDALVRTLTNAIEAGRLAHAFMLTGVRGVGKTTTARIIAKALNCIGADGKGGETVTPCGVCEHCTAITQDRHVDVVEMDAASRTGVDDIREIIDGVRYGPVSARYKIYIIDEVHMLTKNAFNALLKTLEEPPPHVKFLFATTEIRKVPITVLSRCQRFDLRRVDSPTLIKHFAHICKQEEAQIDPDALALLARAADGSVRDGLSLLDQAVALGAGFVSADQVRTMLGLADRGKVIDLFEKLLSGLPDDMLAQFEELYNCGAEPVVVLQDLLDLTHSLTRLRLVPSAKDDASIPEMERQAATGLADKLSMPVLTRIWQILLKGLAEVQQAPIPYQAAEMVLLRLSFASELPAPADLIRELQSRQGSGATGFNGPSGGSSGGAKAHLKAVGGGFVAQAEQVAVAPEMTMAEIARLCWERKEGVLFGLVRSLRPVRLKTGVLEFEQSEDVDAHSARKLSAFLKEATGQRWMVAPTKREGQPSIAELELAAKERELAEVRRHPIVNEILKNFPEADLSIRHLQTDKSVDD